MFSIEPRIGIILVTYNDETNLKVLFNSLNKQTYSNYYVYLLDNCSTDNSVQLAKSLCQHIKITRLEKNEGFAKASNIGSKQAISDGCELILILNNDVELETNCIKELVSLIMNDDNLACVGPLICRGDEKNVIQEYGAHVNFKKYKIKKIATHKAINEINGLADVLLVDFIMGGAIMLKSKIIKKLGLFDERYYMYGEEVDFFYRINNFKYQIAVTKNAKLWHYHYSANGNLTRYYFERYYILRNKYLFFLKYKLYKSLLVSLFRDIVFSAFFYKGHIKRGDLKIFWHHFKGINDGIRNITGKTDKIYT